MIVGTEYRGGPGFLEQYPVDTSEVFGMAIQEAIADNPTTKLFEYNRVQRAGGELVSKEQAEALAKEQGVVVQNLPEEGLKSEALDIMIERQYKRKVRQDAISNAGGGFANGAVEFAGNVVGSALDPVGIASSFIPVVGQARYAALLAKASGPMGRMATRAGVGAIEGAAGAALLEPASYILSQELGDDYTAVNSLMNIAFGTAMGAGLHMGAGAVNDAIRLKRPAQMADPQGLVANQLNELSPEARADAARIAMSQIATDRPIDVGPVVRNHVEREIPITRERRLQAARELDPEAFESLDGIEKEFAELNTEIRRLQEELDSPEPEAVQAANRLDEIDRRLTEQNDPLEVLQQLGDEEQGILARFSKEELELARQDFTEGRASIQPEIERLSKRQGYLGEIRGTFNKRIAEAYKTASRGLKPEMRGETLAEVLKDETPEASLTRRKQITPEIQKTIETPENARFIDNEVLESHQAELAEIPKDQRIEETTEAANQAVADLKEMADQAEIEIEADLKAANEMVVQAEEMTRAMKALANCALRRG